MLQVQAPNHLMDGSCGQVKKDRPFIHKKNVDIEATLQGINISHLGKRKIIFKIPFLGDMLVPWRVSFRTMLLDYHWNGRSLSVCRCWCSQLNVLGTSRNSWPAHETNRRGWCTMRLSCKSWKITLAPGGSKKIHRNHPCNISQRLYLPTFAWCL